MLEGDQPDWLSPESDDTEANEAEGDSAAIFIDPEQIKS